MRLFVLATALLLLPLVAAPAAEAQEWLPVCKDKDVRVGPYAHLHVGVDCDPGIWVVVCPPGEDCRRVDVSLA